MSCRMTASAAARLYELSLKMTRSEGLLQKYDPNGVFVVLQVFQLKILPIIKAVGFIKSWFMKKSW